MPLFELLSDEDTMPPCEKDASTDLNSITSSSEDSSTPSSSTHQNDTPSMSREEYREDNGSSAESTSSIEIEIIELEEPYSDSNAEGPFNLNAGQAIERYSFLSVKVIFHHVTGAQIK